MIQPSMNRLKLANPHFFDSSLGALGEIKEHTIELEEEGWVLKLRSNQDTFPVYKIGEGLALEYLRHGW